jgi:hypothetical protein
MYKQNVVNSVSPTLRKDNEQGMTSHALESNGKVCNSRQIGKEKEQ